MSPHTHRTSTIVTAIVLSLLLLNTTGCKKEDDLADTTSGHAGNSNCVECHTNYSMLKLVHSPDTAAAGGGCGGETPHIEPYDRVYLTPAGYDAFSKSAHGQKACTWCHGGNADTKEKNLAHTGNFIKYPSTQAETKCITCHPSQSITPNSIHALGSGQKAMLVSRYGAQSFDQLPAHLIEGYDHNCAKCHGTCGDCHVNRPKAGGGGLYKGHQFIKTPDMIDQCVACHSSRGGHAFLGIASGTVPDVHKTKLNANCLTCHTGIELHGNGMVYDQRYKVPQLPKCKDCHTTVAASNSYHSAHINSFNCQTCHSQDYNNCGSCHVGGAGARIASHQKFKIGMNPIPETKPYRLATVRQSLMAPDSWSEYGVPVLANFDSKPTYKYTTPHNILRWTTRTQVAAGKSCYDNCHIIKEGTVFRNKNLYLFNTDLESWEVNATKDVVVDGKLPSSWGVN
ncbi:MAG: cytochrome c3 family protein [Bacteroidota bacterium]